MATKPLPTVDWYEVFLARAQEAGITRKLSIRDLRNLAAAARDFLRQRDAAIRAECRAAGAAAERERLIQLWIDLPCINDTGLNNAINNVIRLGRALPPLPPEEEGE